VTCFNVVSLHQNEGTEKNYVNIHVS